MDCGAFQFDDVNVNTDGYNLTNNGVFVRGYVINGCTITFCVGCVSNINPNHFVCNTCVCILTSQASPISFTLVHLVCECKTDLWYKL